VEKKRESEHKATRRYKRNKGTVQRYALVEETEEQEEECNGLYIYTEEEFLEVHQDFCAKCVQYGFGRDLFLCHTCNLGWHKECNKGDMSKERWQCKVCIKKDLSPDRVVDTP
jgi:hypothetical protein